MTGFKPQTSGIESNRSTNSATTTALKTSIFSLHLKINQKLSYSSLEVKKQKVCLLTFSQLCKNAKNT